MTRASELAAAGTPAGQVVVADYQRQGRGTHGRIWTAPPGSCLMLSAVFRPPITVADLSTLPFEIACAIRDALNDRFALNAEVKPPNDVMVGERKLAGILCQSHIRSANVDWVICGIGLNTNLTEQDSTVPGSTSLLTETGREHRHDELLEDLLSALERFRDPCRRLGALARPES